MKSTRLPNKDVIILTNYVLTLISHLGELEASCENSSMARPMPQVAPLYLAAFGPHPYIPSPGGLPEAQTTTRPCPMGLVDKPIHVYLLCVLHKWFTHMVYLTPYISLHGPSETCQHLLAALRSSFPRDTSCPAFFPGKVLTGYLRTLTLITSSSPQSDRAAACLGCH